MVVDFFLFNFFYKLKVDKIVVLIFIDLIENVLSLLVLFNKTLEVLFLVNVFVRSN